MVTSKALTLNDGIVASGGNRHEANQFAIWEFKTGSGQTAYDTSGIDPTINADADRQRQLARRLRPRVYRRPRAGQHAHSDKLQTFIQTTGEYAIEAWVIPANVTQEDANIVSYSGGSTRNFTLGQDMYNYDFYNRIDARRRHRTANPSCPPATTARKSRNPACSTW